jgi:hypothetical protein
VNRKVTEDGGLDMLHETLVSSIFCVIIHELADDGVMIHRRGVLKIPASGGSGAAWLVSLFRTGWRETALGDGYRGRAASRYRGLDGELQSGSDGARQQIGGVPSHTGDGGALRHARLP